MAESLPVVLVPGLNCSPRLYAPQMPELWRFGPVTVADHTRDHTMAAIAKHAGLIENDRRLNVIYYNDMHI